MLTARNAASPSQSQYDPTPAEVEPTDDVFAAALEEMSLELSPGFRTLEATSPAECDFFGGDIYGPQEEAAARRPWQLSVDRVFRKAFGF